MKYRSDFVTNSSSSSFVCFGVNADAVLYKIAEKLRQALSEQSSYNSPLSEIEYMEDDENPDIAELSKRFNGSALSVGGYEGGIVGVTVSDLATAFPDAKIGDINKIVAAEVNKVFGTDFAAEDIEYCEEVWYDG